MTSDVMDSDICNHMDDGIAFIMGPDGTIYINAHNLNG